MSIWWNQTKNWIKTFPLIRFSLSCSYLPWFEIYYKLLNTLADYLTKQQVILSVSDFMYALSGALLVHYMQNKIWWFDLTEKQAHSLVFFETLLWWDIFLHPVLLLHAACCLLCASFVRRLGLDLAPVVSSNNVDQTLIWHWKLFLMICRKTNR